jgi:hypothetical protein
MSRCDQQVMRVADRGVLDVVGCSEHSAKRLIEGSRMKSSSMSPSPEQAPWAK